MSDTKGNPHVLGAQLAIDAGMADLGSAVAQLAIAFELRTLTLALTQNTPGWLDEVRGRLGHPAVPDLPVEDDPDRRCNKRWVDGRNEVRCWGAEGHEGECT